MLITINTEEALLYSLSIQDCAVLDVIRKLIADCTGAVEIFQKRKYKWLSDKLIMSCLQCSSFGSCRQLLNIIKKLCACGIIKKRMYLGKPFYCDCRQQKVTAAPRPPQHTQTAAQAAPPRPVRSAELHSTSAATAPDGQALTAAATKQEPPETLTPEQAKQAIEELDKHLQSTPPETLGTVRDGRIIPSAEDVQKYVEEKEMHNFDVQGFILYNAKRKWSGIYKKTWRQLAEQWYFLQCKHTPDIITYQKYADMCSRDKSTPMSWVWSHTDKRTGQSYFRKRTEEEKQKYLQDNKRTVQGYK